MRFAFQVSALVVPIAGWAFHLTAIDGGCRIEHTWVDRRIWPVRVVSTVRTA
jgi:hypothetical protein